MTFQKLRIKHPEFHYRSFDYEVDDDGNFLNIEFVFEMSPDIVFRPKVSIPIDGLKVDLDNLDYMVFHLGLVEMISYWKAAASPKILIYPFELSDDQIAWWNKLMMKGLGEYWAVNEIDPHQNELFEIISVSSKQGSIGKISSLDNSHLIMVGGGKDSALSMQLVSESLPESDNQALMLNPTRAALETAKTAGFDKPIVIKRVIDPKLIELNDKGYLNGHTPFSAYLSLLSLLVARLYGYKYVLASNEQSANEVTVNYRGIQVNHQYSKSFEYEQDFREYCDSYLDDGSEYLSFLRPLYELKIAKEFANYPKYFDSFLSCNVGGRDDVWCGDCPKCLFKYLMLAPYLKPEVMESIFKSKLLDNLGLADDLRGLLTDAHPKPFECVGTRKETRVACWLAIRHYNELGQPLPKLLVLAKELIGGDSSIETEVDEVLSHFDENHFLPEHLLKVLAENIGEN